VKARAVVPVSWRAAAGEVRAKIEATFRRHGTNPYSVISHLIPQQLQRTTVNQNRQFSRRVDQAWDFFSLVPQWLTPTTAKASFR
jgi:hypothetical protein